MLSMVSVAFERMGLSDARACIPTTWQTMILEPSGFGGWKPSTSILSTCLMLHSISLVFGSRSLSGGDHIAQEAHTQTHKQLHLRLDLRSVTSIGAAKLVCVAGHMTKFTTRLRYANKMFATINTKVQLRNHAFIQTSTRKKIGYRHICQDARKASGTPPRKSIGDEWRSALVLATLLRATT